MVIGLVGGVSGIIWTVLNYLLANYQEFKYENSLVACNHPGDSLDLDPTKTPKDQAMKD